MSVLTQMDGHSLLFSKNKRTEEGYALTPCHLQPVIPNPVLPPSLCSTRRRETKAVASHWCHRAAV